MGNVQGWEMIANTKQLKVVEIPVAGTLDVPSALRKLASQIEAGEFGDAHNLAWVIDCGDSRIECGLAGRAPEPGATGFMLFALAQRKIERGILGD